MPKITIEELDLTTPGVVNESTDVVYIPGLVNLDQDSLYEDASHIDDTFTRGAYKGLGFRQPHLFTSVSEFTTLCGEKPYKFTEKLKYSDISGLGFSDNAKPVEDILVGEGVSDPAYVMAKELLAAGMCVMYERINYYNHSDGGYDSDIDGSYVKVTDVPDGTDGEGYYYRHTGATTEYRKYGTDGINDTVPQPATGTDMFLLTPVQSAPSDFSTTYINHYKLNPVTNKLEAYTTATFDAQKSNFTIADDKTEFSTVSKDWNNIYNNYAYKNGNDYYRFALEKKLFDSGNCYQFIPGVNVNSIYGELEQVFSTGDEIVDGLIDKGNYSVKYLTTGGYPVYEYNRNSIVTNMLNFASKRGDCVALIDHTDFKSRETNPFRDGSLYKTVETDADTTFKANGDFGAMFTPWATYNRTTSDGDEVNEDGAKVPYSHTAFRAPASFAYLTALADSIKTNANWLAIAGATRGGVMNLSAGGMDTTISNGIADAMQPRDSISINAITNIKPYGYTIWGNRTLKKNVDNLVATSFLNIRNLVSDVKKTCYRTARAMTFEQDTDILWINFKAEISKLLNRMVSGYGISGFKIIRDTTHVRAAEKATICAKVILYPTYAVEDFYITIVLKDDEVTVE